MCLADIRQLNASFLFFGIDWINDGVNILFEVIMKLLHALGWENLTGMILIYGSTAVRVYHPRHSKNMNISIGLSELRARGICHNETK